jgi:hypothetical protein
MTTWAKCKDKHDEAIWINLDNVTIMTRRNKPDPGTEIVFVSGGEVVVQETPEYLTDL